MNRSDSRRGETNVPALIGLLIAIVAILASFLPVCGACVAIPGACVALLLAIIGFATAKKHDSGTGLAAGATVVSILSLLISIGWFVWIGLEAAKEEERQKQADAKVHGVNEEAYELDDVAWKVNGVTQWNPPGEKGSTVDVRVTGRTTGIGGGYIDSSCFRLVDGAGKEHEPIHSFAHELEPPSRDHLLRFELPARDLAKVTFVIVALSDLTKHSRRFELTPEVKEATPEVVELDTTTRPRPAPGGSDWDD